MNIETYFLLMYFLSIWDQNVVYTSLSRTFLKNDNSQIWIPHNAVKKKQFSAIATVSHSKWLDQITRKLRNRVETSLLPLINGIR